MDYLPQFKLWLISKNYSESTIRNYLVDLGKYLNYVNSLSESVSLDLSAPSAIHILSSDIVSGYVSYLSGKNNSSRYLASLNQFCQFALDQHLISANPFKSIHKTTAVPNASELIGIYQQHLTKHNTPISTVRNYINDLHQYISWLETQKLDSQ
jgi:site-specific recombinase XerD